MRVPYSIGTLSIHLYSLYVFHSIDSRTTSQPKRSLVHWS